MTNQQQRIAIAEACGWQFDYVGRGAIYYVPTRDIYVGDPITDLNAMHEAESFFATDHMKKLYRNNIASSFISGRPFDDLHATAAKRAEAFLKTIGKWKES